MPGGWVEICYKITDIVKVCECCGQGNHNLKPVPGGLIAICHTRLPILQWKFDQEHLLSSWKNAAEIPKFCFSLKSKYLMYS